MEKLKITIFHISWKGKRRTNWENNFKKSFVVPKALYKRRKSNSLLERERERERERVIPVFGISVDVEDGLILSDVVGELAACLLLSILSISCILDNMENIFLNLFI